MDKVIDTITVGRYELLEALRSIPGYLMNNDLRKVRSILRDYSLPQLYCKIEIIERCGKVYDMYDSNGDN